MLFAVCSGLPGTKVDWTFRTADLLPVVRWMRPLGPAIFHERPRVTHGPDLSGF